MVGEMQVFIILESANLNNMKKLLLLLLLSFGFIGTSSAHLEDAIFCKAKVMTGYIGGMENVLLELSVVAQNNTDSSKQYAAVGVFSPSGELVSLHDVFSGLSAVEPGSTATYLTLEKLTDLVSPFGSEAADIQAEIEHQLPLYTEMYKDSTCKILGYR